MARASGSPSSWAAKRSTAALDSLKVIAFDLAAMCMSIEGGAHQPAFLIHDSPREADLGLSIFHRLFHLVHGMEGIGERPQFQYILTTTTSPPARIAGGTLAGRRPLAVPQGNGF